MSKQKQSLPKHLHTKLHDSFYLKNLKAAAFQ